MLYFGLYVQLRRGSVAGYTTDESWAYGPKEGVEAFESITFFIRFIYAINFEHLIILQNSFVMRPGDGLLHCCYTNIFPMPDVYRQECPQHPQCLPTDG